MPDESDGYAPVLYRKNQLFNKRDSIAHFVFLAVLPLAC